MVASLIPLTVRGSDTPSSSEAFENRIGISQSGTNLAALYAVTAGFFACSVAILIWALRTWAARSRLAYLIPPLIIAAVFIMQALFDQIVH